MFKKSKKIYELSIDELKKKSKGFRATFYCYIMVALGIAFISGFYGLQSINNVMRHQADGTLFLLLLVAVLCCLNFLMLIFMWFINESSYYKMLEQFSDLIIYLKQKEK
jgi:hypothetical protein